MLELIPVFYQSVRRTALVIRSKKPFYDWLLRIYPGDDSSETLKNGTSTFKLLVVSPV